MQKIARISFILVLIFVLIFVYSLSFHNEAKARKVLHKHLQSEHNEEFAIGLMGIRSMNNDKWYEARILPQRYVGTLKEIDSYYWSNGFVDIERFKLVPGDTYGGVLLNEDANKFFGKKIEELFGPNYICAIDVGGQYEYTSFLKEQERKNELYAARPDGNFLPIGGAIYVFGRVDNNSDREYYRGKIHEFILYMKEVKSFEYVAMWMVVLDERVLSDAFAANKEDQERLLDLYSAVGEKYSAEIKDIAYKNPETFDKDPEIIAQIEQLYKEVGKTYLKEKAEIMDKYTESYNNTSEENVQSRIENFGKSQIRRKAIYNVFLTAPMFSPRHLRGIKARSIRQTNFEKVGDVHFTEELYYKGE